jgi:hypothetical protein
VRAEQRRMAIERANKGLFDATDDVKALHSKLLLSEVSTPNTPDDASQLRMPQTELPCGHVQTHLWFQCQAQHQGHAHVAALQCAGIRTKHLRMMW